MENRKIYSTDSLPSLSQQESVFPQIQAEEKFQNWHSEHRRIYHYSDTYLAPTDMQFIPPTFQLLKEISTKFSQSNILFQNYKEKKFFFAMETMTTEWVYVQLLDMIASVFSFFLSFFIFSFFHFFFSFLNLGLFKTTSSKPFNNTNFDTL